MAYVLRHGVFANPLPRSPPRQRRRARANPRPPGGVYKGEEIHMPDTRSWLARYKIASGLIIDMQSPGAIDRRAAFALKG